MQARNNKYDSTISGHLSAHFVDELSVKTLTMYREVVRTVHTCQDTKFIQTRNNIK
jgi:hypothetical protein